MEREQNEKEEESRRTVAKKRKRKSNAETARGREDEIGMQNESRR